MGASQRRKGADAEREVVNILREHGINAKRGQVFNNEPDIITDSNIHYEVKRQEQIRIAEWTKQAEEAAGNCIPVVVYRKSRDDWHVSLRLNDFLELTGNTLS